MHIVTKILVVFAAVLSVLLAALTMSYAVNADRIVGEIGAERNLRIAAETTAANDMAAHRVAEQDLRDQLQAKADQATSLEINLRQLEADRAQLLKDKAMAEAARSAIEAKIADLGTTVQTQAALIQSYRDEVTQLRDNELRYRQNEIQLVDRINDLESQIEVATANVRALQEQLTEARMALEGAAVAGGSGTAQGPQTTRVPVRGRIVSTMRDQATGALLVRIDVGTNDQVRENMKLYVSRGEDFLGNLVIRQADLQWAIGQIDTLGRDVEIRNGDLVTNALR